MFRRVYLDNSATTPIDREVVDVMIPFLTEKFGNASSIHFYGQEARSAVDKARHQVAEIINAVDEQIDATQCGGHENCRDEGRCMTHDLWATLNSKILDYLDGISLADMVASQNIGQKVLIKPRACGSTKGVAVENVSVAMPEAIPV